MDNIAELILSASADSKKGESATAPDPLTHPAEALDFHRKRYALNQKVVDNNLPEVPEGSDRVRLRRAAEELAECGLVTTGGFAQGYVAGANISVSGSFGSDGNLWRRGGLSVTVNDCGHMDKDDVLGLVQKVLQHWGFPVVVALDGSLASAEAGNETEVRWSESGVRPSYIGAGTPSPTPEQMIQYSAALSGARTYAVSDWATSKFSPEQARDWCDKRVNTPREALVWAGRGLDSAGAQEWLDAGLQLQPAGDWLAAGYTPADAKPWVAAGANYPQAAAWISEGYTPAQAQVWIGFCRRGLIGVVPADVKMLMDAGVDSKKLERLQEAGCDGSLVESLAKWVGRYKITIAEALEWAELGPDFVGPGKRGRWNKAGFSAEEVRNWQKALGTRSITLDLVKGKIAAGFDPNTSGDWVALDSHFGNSDLIDSWTKAGLDIKDAKPWVEAHFRFCDYSLVATWTDQGLGVKDARSWVLAEQRFCDYKLVKQWEAVDARIVGNPDLASQLMRVQNPDSLREALGLLGNAGA